MLLEILRNDFARSAVQKIAPIQAYSAALAAAPANWPKGNHAAACITFDCDYQKDVDALPKIMQALSSAGGARASFACVGRLVEKNPRVHQKLLDEGHEIVNHTHTHPNNEIFSPNRFFNKLSEKEALEEITRMQETCKKLLGSEPSGFRTPHFGRLHGEFVYPLLKKLGFRYSSSVTAIPAASNLGDEIRALPFYRQGVLELPISTCPKHLLNPLDSWHAFGCKTPMHGEKEYLDLFEFALERGVKSGGFVNFYFDPAEIAKREPFFLKLLEKIESKKMWVAKMDEVANWWIKNA